MKATDLPIYRAGRELTTLGTQIIQDMNRAHRMTVGRSIRERSQELLLEIAYANRSKGAERVEHINKVIRLNDLIELDFRAAGDIRLIPTQKWAAGIALTAQIGKQAGGWLKASNKAPDALGASLQ
jgi:hypothetical protein